MIPRTPWLFVSALMIVLIRGSIAFGEPVLATVLVGKAPEIESKVSVKQVGKVSFTFDCAQWGDKGLDHILEVMEKKQITGTFFVTGKFIETNKEGIGKIAKAGHEVANHSYEHDKKNSVAECNKVARLYKEATGKEMSPYFRAPYLYEDKIDWNDYADKGWLKGYVSIITCDALTEFKRISDRVFLNNFRYYVKHGAEERIAIHKTISQKGPGHINGAAILMHIDGYRYHLLEQMVDIVERTGYQCSTFSEARSAREVGEWFLNPKNPTLIPGLLPKSKLRNQEPPGFIKLSDARPDPERMATARQAIAGYTPDQAIVDRGQFSFTFNCHNYNRIGLGTILVLLRQTQTPATFYISERYLQQVPGAVKQILEHGHEIAYFAIGDEGTKTFSDADKFDLHFKNETGEELVHLFRPPHAEGIENNYAIANWSHGYSSLTACDTDLKWQEVKDGSFIAYFKIYLSIAPKQQVSIMNVPYSGTGNIDGGVIAMHPNGVRYHLLVPMIKSVRAKGYTIVPQSKLRTNRL